MKKSVKRNIISTSISLLVAITISIILVCDESITATGGLILGIFQVAVFNTFIHMFFFESDISELQKTKSITEKIINSFGESLFLSKKVETALLKDLEFDKNVKTKLKHIKDHHIYFSKIKIDIYAQEFFIYDSENMIITDVPGAYFENMIWKKLIKDSSFYFSVQLLINEQKSVYLDNPERSIREIGILKNKINGSNNQSLSKIFVVDQASFTADNKIVELQDVDIYKYLKKWYDAFESHNNVFPIKVIKASNVLGHLNEDIGIFGDMLYGVQRIRNIDQKKIMGEKLKFDFYFNPDDVSEKIDLFNNCFKSDIAFKLEDVLA